MIGHFGWLRTLIGNKVNTTNGSKIVGTMSSRAFANSSFTSLYL